MVKQNETTQKCLDSFGLLKYVSVKVACGFPSADQ